MSVQKLTCYVITCDTCRIQFDQAGEDYIVHFDTADAAIAYAAEHGWAITETGDLICPHCWAVDLCGRLGHLWGAWIPCDCGGEITRHATNGCGLIRRCDQCDHHEYTTLADLPTIDEPTSPGR